VSNKDVTSIEKSSIQRPFEQSLKAIGMQHPDTGMVYMGTTDVAAGASV